MSTSIFCILKMQLTVKLPVVAQNNEQQSTKECKIICSILDAKPDICDLAEAL